MDRSRFDQFTRSIASGKSRREVLKMLIGGAAAGAVAAVTRGGQAEAVCYGMGVSCSGNSDCCNPWVCVNGMCAPDLCAGPGVSCANLSCCSGFTCQGGVCVGTPKPVCKDHGGYCSYDGDCCGDLLCINGTCKYPAPVCKDQGGYCSSDHDCCYGLVCHHGICKYPEPVCVGHGGYCSSSYDCCHGLDCHHGVCKTHHSGGDNGGHQPQDTGGTTSTMVVTALPSTGVGAQANESAGWKGVTLAGSAAAALFTAKLLRRKSSDQGQDASTTTPS